MRVDGASVCSTTCEVGYLQTDSVRDRRTKNSTRLRNFPQYFYIHVRLNHMDVIPGWGDEGEFLA